jgi:SSS family solute:Na+ symporter
LFVVIVIFNAINDESVVSGLFKVAGYTYGPLLGLYAFGMFTKRHTQDKGVPVVCIVAPVLSYVLQDNAAIWFNGYKIGFELLLINGMLTFSGLWLLSLGNASPVKE